ncbi:hypothetical protein Dalu01_03627 [Deinococcus aluminii]|uniref:Uncharacterized protein n=2 Tax=Deinococcus aluminii TaxID=1656885 RepID=A0ABP9XIL1_9DEIO
MYETVYRFDKRSISTPKKWMPSSNGEAVYVPDGSLASFTKAAKNAKTVAMRVYDFDYTPITQTFSLSGLTTALKKLPCAKGI